MVTEKQTSTALEVTTILKKLKNLQDIMGDFVWEKDGKNTHQSYKYITEMQYKSNFKKALKQSGLIWKMETVGHQFIESVSEKMHMIICDFKGQLIDPESGEREEYLFCGSGADNGDKALYKAVTGGHKFYIAANFNVAENNDPESDEAEAPPKSNIPATPEKREEVKAELIDKDGNASKMQLTSLKKVLSNLRAIDPTQDEFIAAIARNTEAFTKIKKKACEELIIRIGDLIEIAKGGKTE